MSNQMKIVISYAIWTTICAAVACGAAALVYLVARGNASGWATTTLIVAVGQGAIALLTGALLAPLGRTLRSTVLLGLLIGLFDLAVALAQTFVPATEVGWRPTLAILAAAAAAITLLGQTRAAPSS